MKYALVILAGLLCVTVPVMAADSFEDFDSYTAGVVIPPGNGWVGWGGPTANGIVTAGPANSQPNSLAVLGGQGTDQVYEFGYEAKTGVWDFSIMTYVPSDGKAGRQYFNLMNVFVDVAPTNYQWSNVEVSWEMRPGNASENMVFVDTMEAGKLPIQYDTWVKVNAHINLDANSVQVFYGGASLGTTTWSKGAAAVHGIDVLDIYPATADASVMYYDDLSLVLVPEPATMLLLGISGLGVLIRRRRR